MKTAIDLRIKYKFDTGNHPTWCDTWNSYSYTKGKLKSIYGIWLEEQFGNQSNLRDNYYKYSGCKPIYKKNRYYICDCLTQEYMLWLEDKYLPIFEKIDELYNKGIKIFGTVNFDEWLRMTSYGLGGVKPIDLLNSMDGVNSIIYELSSIEYGTCA